MKTCGDCKETKDCKNFSKSCTTKDGLQWSCKTCQASRELARNRTFIGALQVLVKSARASAKRRARSGRHEAAMVDIDRAYLVQLWERQEGKCYYSNIPLSLEIGIWQVSLERLDQSAGYIKGNVVLCCLAFNTFRQWTVEIVRELVEVHLSADKQPIVFNRRVKKAKTYSKSPEDRIVDGLTYICCYSCREYKPSTDFLAKRGYGCATCRAEHLKEKRLTLEGRLDQMLGGARAGIKKRNQNKNRRHLDFNLTRDDLLQLLQTQNGRCAISMVPLELGTNSQLSVSIDRLDVNVGYTAGNVRLVSALFNPTDSTARNKSQEGIWGWTEERYNFFIQHARQKFEF